MRYVLAILLVGFVVTVVGCGPSISEVRMGPARPARPENCHLDFYTVGAAEMMPSARFGANGEFESIGVVSLALSGSGRDPMSPEVRDLVRPRACELGAEAISLNVSADGANRMGSAQTNVMFMLWARRAARSTAPQTF